MEWWRWVLIGVVLIGSVCAYRALARRGRSLWVESASRAVWEAEQRESREQRRGRS